jgi:hypothetical protein
MSSKIYQIVSGNMSAALTAVTPNFAIGTSNPKALLQVAPALGFEVIEWGISFSGSAAATPTICELVEVDVAASAGTASYIPAATVSTAITNAATTSLVLANAIQASAATFQIGTMAFPAGPTQGATGGQEHMLVTAGGNTATLTVTRGINGTTALASIPAGTLVYGILASDVYSDIIPLSEVPFADPTHALLAITGTAATGFNFTTYNSPTRVRVLDSQELPPTAPYIKQFPLERGVQAHPGRFLQIRTNGSSGINGTCYMTVAV